MPSVYGYGTGEIESDEPLACARCGRQLRSDRCVTSNRTGSSYCWPGEGCQEPTPPAMALVEGTEEIQGWSVGAPLESIADVEYADEDESGQLGLGVPGEQRAIPTLAGPVKLADHGREVDIAGVRFRIEVPFAGQLRTEG